MAVKDSVVNLLLKATNAISDPANEAAASLYDAQLAVDDLNSELKRLEQQDKLIQEFKALSSESEAIKDRFQEANRTLAETQAAYKGVKNPTVEMRQALAEARTEAQIATAEYKNHERQLSKVETQLTRTSTDTSDLTKEEARLAEQAGKTGEKLKEANKTLLETAQRAKEAASESMNFGSIMGKIQGILATFAVAKVTKKLIDLSDQYKSLQSQLKLVTEDQEELNSTFDALHDIANATSTPLEATIDLYQKLKQNTKELDVSNEDLLTVTKAVSQSFLVSGASAAEADRAIVQLSQGLSKNKVELQDLKSVMESSPRTIQALADGLGVTTGRLQEMAGQGEITAQALVSAFKKSADGIAADAEKVNETVGNAMQRLTNDMLAAFGKADMSGFNRAIDDFRETVTDPGFVSAITTLGEGIANLAGWTAKATKETVEFTKWLGESAAAAINGIADDDIPRLEMRLDQLKTALTESYWNRDILDAFKSRKTIEQELLELQDRLEKAYKQQEEAAAAAAAQREVADKKAKESAAGLAGGLKDLNKVIEETDKLGKLTGESISDALKKATSIEELNSLRAIIQDIFDNGKMSVVEYGDAIGELTGRIIDFEGGQSGAAKSIEKTDKAAKQAKDSLKEMGDSGKESLGQTVSIAAGLAGIINRIRDGMMSLSVAAYNAYQGMVGGSQAASNDLQSLEQRLATVNQQLSQAQTNFSATGEHGWGYFNKLELASRSTEKAFLEQRIAMQKLVDAYNEGDYSAAQFGLSLDTIDRQFNLLDKQDLSSLKNAIKGVQDQAKALTDSLEGTVKNLQMELAGLQNDNKRVEELRHIERKTELEKQYQLATAAGNQEAARQAREALSLLDQTHQLRLKDIATQDEERRVREADRAANEARRKQEQDAKDRAQAAPLEKVETVKTIKLELKAPSGRNVAASFGSQREADDFLAALEQAGLTAI